jgi:hypothetical protein
MDGENKLYINMVVSGTHVNGAYEATASTVYTYDSEHGTLLATVEGAPYWFGTRNDKTYTTMGPCKVEYEGFFGQFYVDSTETPEEPEVPEVPEFTLAEELVVGKAYKFGMTQGNLENAVYYLAGGMSGFYMATTTDPVAGIDVYVEQAEGGYYLYFMNGETKNYIYAEKSGSHNNIKFGATQTVWTYDEDLGVFITNLSGSNVYMGTYSTYVTISLSYTSYINASNVDKSQFAARPVVVAAADAE